MKKSIAFTIISILAVVCIALGLLYYTNNTDKNHQIETLSAESTNRANQITALTTEVSEKTSQLETLNADIAEKTAQIDSLNAEVAERDSKIETMTADIAKKDLQIKSLNEDVASKVQQIDALIVDNASKDTQIKTLSADLAEKVTQIETLSTNATIKDAQIEALISDVASKDEQINMLKDDATQKTAQLEKLNKTLAENDKQIQTLTADAAAKDKQIQTLTADVEAKSTQIIEYTQRIESLNQDITKKDNQIDLLKDMIATSSYVADSNEYSNPLLITPTAEYVMERLSTIPEITGIAAATEDHDPNDNLGKQGGYTAQIYFTSSLVNPISKNRSDYEIVEAGTVAGGSIEIYANTEDANKRNKYLSAIDTGFLSSGSHTVVGTMVIRTSKNLSASEQKKLEQEIIDALSAETVEELTQDKPNTAPVDEIVTIQESGFQVKGKYLYYSFVAHNNLTDKALYLPAFRITARNAAGNLLCTHTQVLNVIYPNQTTKYGGMASSINEIPAVVEIEFEEPEDDWHIVNPNRLKQAEYTPIEVKSAKIKEDSYFPSIVGELHNPNDYGFSTVAITVLFRDTDGKLLAGDTSFVNNLKGGKTMPFEFSVSKDLITNAFEIFVQPW